MADHKEDVDNEMLKARVKSLSLLVVYAYSAISTVLSLAGVNQLPFTTDEVATGAYAALTACLSLYMWWRDNPMTKAGLVGKQLTRAVKADATEIKTSANVIETNEVPEATDEELASFEKLIEKIADKTDSDKADA